jgi:hypothetical protein
MRPVASLLSSAARCRPARGGRPAISMLFSSSPWTGKPRGTSELGREAVASVRNSAPGGTSQNIRNYRTPPRPHMFKNRPNLRKSQLVDDEVDVLFAAFDEAKLKHMNGTTSSSQGPYQLHGQYSRACFERFRSLSDDYWKLAYLEEERLVVFYGDPSIPHEACARHICGQIMGQLHLFLRAAPSTGDAITDKLIAETESLCDVADEIFEDAGSRTTELRRNSGGVVLKEPDISINVQSPLKNTPLVLGEIAYRNESFEALVSEVWWEKTVAPVVIGVKASVN